MTPDPVFAALLAATPEGMVLRPPPLRARPADLCSAPPVLMSHLAGWRDLVILDDTHSSAEFAPPLRQGWTDTWTVTVRRAKTLQNLRVSDLGWADVEGADPMIVADWHPARRARAGLEHMTSTDRHHAFSSLNERRLLVALDFEGVHDVTSQPFTLTWRGERGWRRHTPDFVVRTDAGVVLVNVRPSDLLDDQHHSSSAAAAAVALSRGWQFVVVSGYSRPALDVVEACAYDRHAPDRAGLAGELLSLFDHGPLTFADAADSTEAFGFNRQLLRAFIHDRLLTMDLSVGLCDSTVLRLPQDSR